MDKIIKISEEKEYQIMRKVSVFSIILIIVLGVFTACSTNNINDEEKTMEDTEEKRIEDKEQTETERDDRDDAKDKEDSDSYKRVEEIGIYNGQADPHTIEIETAEGPTAFQLSDEAREYVEELETEDEVIYTYYEKDEQKVIEFIEEYWYHRRHHNDEDIERHHRNHHMDNHHENRHRHHEERYKERREHHHERHHNNDEK